MQIVFGSPGYHYQSYYDLHRVFSNCGVPHIKFPEMSQLPDNCAYVYTPANGELNGHYETKNRRFKMFWWFLERIEPNGYDNFRKAFEAKHWDGIILSDRGFYYKMRDMGINAVLCPLGYHPLFGVPNFRHPKTYDLAHMSYDALWRRSQLFGKLQKYKIAPNAWGDQRRDYLYSSKFMFNTHQDETKNTEPLRLMMGVAHGLPIISERCEYSYPYDIHPCTLMQATIGDLPAMVEHTVDRYSREPDMYIEQAVKNFDYFSKECLFFPEVEKAVAILLKQL